MSHFAYVEDQIVKEVIVAEQDFVDSLPQRPGQWIQTSYNTRRGIHLLGGTPLRKNFAGLGYTYDAERDAFIPPQDYGSWILDEDTCVWKAPVPCPEDGKVYSWNEFSQSWIEWPYQNGASE